MYVTLVVVGTGGLCAQAAVGILFELHSAAMLAPHSPLCSLLARFTPWEFTRFGIGALLSVRKGLYTDR